MAEGIVVGLEIIQIEQQQAQRLAVPARLGDPLTQRQVVTAPIGQAAQGIMLGHPAQQLAHQELVALRILVNVAADGTDDQQQQVVADGDPVLGHLFGRENQTGDEHIGHHDQHRAEQCPPEGHAEEEERADDQQSGAVAEVQLGPQGLEANIDQRGDDPDEHQQHRKDAVGLGAKGAAVERQHQHDDTGQDLQDAQQRQRRQPAGVGEVEQPVLDIEVAGDGDDQQQRGEPLRRARMPIQVLAKLAFQLGLEAQETKPAVQLPSVGGIAKILGRGMVDHG